MKYTIYLLAILLLITSCTGRNESPSVMLSEPDYVPKYAKGFWLGKTDNTKVFQVVNPWQGASDVEFTYYLKPNADPKVMNEIKIPVKRAICLSTTHIAFIDAVSETNTINGVSGASYISNPEIIKGLTEKQIIDVGYEASLSYEQVVSLNPDVVFAYGVSGELSAVANKLNELGIKIVFLGDYLEETALGKAEWLVAISAFFNKETEAQTKFEQICSEYNTLAELARKEENKPKVMLNAPWKDSWFVPGGNSYMTNLLKDSGAEFVIAPNNKRDSYPISIELAYTNSLDAEFWLNPNASKSIADVIQVDSRLANIPALKNNKLYNNNARITKGGGSDFWESGVINPHIILKDMIKIFHPHLIPEHELVYHCQLR